MNLRAGVLSALLLAGLCQTSFGYPRAGSPRTGSLVNQASPSLDAIAAQSAQDYQIQQANAQAAARAQAMKAAYAEAVAEERWDDAVKKLTDARDQVLADLEAECQSNQAVIFAKEQALNDRILQFSNEVTTADAAAEHEAALENYLPTDPWRMINGNIQYAKGKDWVAFEGEILEVQPSGIFVHGRFGPPLEQNFGERDYFVADFPHKVADGETITSNMQFNALFLENTTFVITNNNRNNGGVHTVRGLEYGLVVTNPPPELAAKYKQMPFRMKGDDADFHQKIADFQHEADALEDTTLQLKGEYEKKYAAVRAECDVKIAQLRVEFANEKKSAAEAREKALQDKVLKYNQEQADKGDPIGLLRMGERYRDGDGVPKDLAKAKDYLQKAADAGSPTAADDLKKLSTDGTGL